jgi:hypothetical protein
MGSSLPLRSRSLSRCPSLSRSRSRSSRCRGSRSRSPWSSWLCVFQCVAPISPLRSPSLSSIRSRAGLLDLRRNSRLLLLPRSSDSGWSRYSACGGPRECIRSVRPEAAEGGYGSGAFSAEGNDEPSLAKLVCRLALPRILAPRSSRRSRSRSLSRSRSVSRAALSPSLSLSLALSRSCCSGEFRPLRLSLLAALFCRMLWTLEKRLSRCSSGLLSLSRSPPAEALGPDGALAGGPGLAVAGDAPAPKLCCGGGPTRALRGPDGMEDEGPDGDGKFCVCNCAGTGLLEMLPSRLG